MPVVYQARCDRCSYSSAVFPAEYGAVLVDEPPADRQTALVAGAVLSGAVGDPGFARQSDPRLVVLAHPIEEHILAGTGYTWFTLAREGRYVWVRRVVCGDCGTLFDVRRLTFPSGLGYQVGCLMSLAAGVAVGFWQESFWLGFGAAYGVVMLWSISVGAAGRAYTRFRFRDRAAAIDGPSCCPECESRRYFNVGSRPVLLCPSCHERSVRIRAVGKS